VKWTFDAAGEGARAVKAGMVFAAVEQCRAAGVRLPGAVAGSVVPSRRRSRRAADIDTQRRQRRDQFSLGRRQFTGGRATLSGVYREFAKRAGSSCCQFGLTTAGLGGVPGDGVSRPLALRGTAASLRRRLERVRSLRTILPVLMLCRATEPLDAKPGRQIQFLGSFRRNRRQYWWRGGPGGGAGANVS